MIPSRIQSFAERQAKHFSGKTREVRDLEIGDAEFYLTVTESESGERDAAGSGAQ
jgi:hypothetical protein